MTLQQPVVRQGPLWIVEPPLSTGEQMSVNDPLQSLAAGRSGHSHSVIMTSAGVEKAGRLHLEQCPANALGPDATMWIWSPTWL
jgi:hypothetical protein